MAYFAYAFRIGRDAQLLDEAEWAVIEPMLKGRIGGIMAFRRETGYSIEEARQREPAGQAALARYHEMTGTKLDHPDQLWGVRMRNYGALCPNCRKPFRAPRAKMCAECGFQLPKGQRAGFLVDSAN